MPHSKRKLTQENAELIRMLWDDGIVDQVRLAEQFGISTSAVEQILNNKTYCNPSYIRRRKAKPTMPTKAEMLAYIEKLKKSEKSEK